MGSRKFIQFNIFNEIGLAFQCIEFSVVTKGTYKTLRRRAGINRRLYGELNA